jgi:hypothetical protein
MFENLKDGFEAYKMFVCIRNHFMTPSYDMFRYGGKSNVTYAAYEKRKDKFLFDKLARLPYARLRTVASFIEGIEWVNDIVADKGYEALIKHQKYLEAASYTFKQELTGLPQPLSALVGTASGTPRLAQFYFQKKVSLETLVIINDLVDFVSIWKDKCSADPLIKQLLTVIYKYRPFVVYDKQKIEQIFTDFYINR